MLRELFWENADTRWWAENDTIYIWFQFGSDDQTLINMYIHNNFLYVHSYTTIYLGLSMLHTLYIETPYITSVVQEGTYVLNMQMRISLYSGSPLPPWKLGASLTHLGMDFFWTEQVKY